MTPRRPRQEQTRDVDARHDQHERGAGHHEQQDRLPAIEHRSVERDGPNRPGGRELRVLGRNPRPYQRKF